MVGRSHGKALAINVGKNMDFWNFFVWLKCMRDLIFGCKNFFWLGSFFGHFFQISWIKKWPQPKNFYKMKNQFFRAHQPCEKNFEFHSSYGFHFMTEFWNFNQLFQSNGTFFKKNFATKNLTSSTHAQKWSKAFGWMSPHVNSLRKFSLGSGFISLLMKKTPLFFKGVGQSECATKCPEKFWLITNS